MKTTLLQPIAGVFAVTLFIAPLAHADRWDDALALVPPTAQSALIVPSPKQASDDLQQGIERMGRQEVAMGGRPIDLLRAQLGIGAGFDDKGMLVAWSQSGTMGTQWALMVPVTDANAFIRSTLKGGEGEPAPDAVYTPVPGGPPVYARTVGKHVLVSVDNSLVKGYAPGTGLAPVLAANFNARGQQVARSGDVLLWAGHEMFKGYAKSMRDQAANVAQLLGTPDQSGKSQPVDAYVQQLQQMSEASAAVVEQIADAAVTADFDAMGVGLRSFVRFVPESSIATAIPKSAQPVSDKDAAAMLVNLLPGARFYLAGGVDVRAMGGLANLRKAISALPMSNSVQIPAWLDAVQDKIDGIQCALYPSKLPVLTGGLVNDASLVIRTKDAAAVRNALRDWVNAQQGSVRPGIKVEATWEESRQVKEGLGAAAFAVKETVVSAAEVGDPMPRLAMQMVVGARGLHGLAAEVPGALVVTFSQRADVLERAMKAAKEGMATSTAQGAAAEAAAGTLASQGVIKAFGPWLMPDPDGVVFLGIGELMVAAQQIAASMPGGSPDMVPLPDGPVEPIGAASRARDGSWEAALMIPSTAMALGYDAVLKQMLRAQAVPTGTPQPEATPTSPSRAPQGAPPAAPPSSTP